MPHDTLSEHFPLGAELGQFLDMPITRQEIDDFVTAPCPDHWRQRGTGYRVSNVFAIPMGTSTRGHHHDLCGTTLAVGGDTALLMSNKVQRADIIDNAAICVALGGRDMSERGAATMQRVTGSDFRDAWRAWSLEHDKDVQAVCRRLNDYWDFAVYEGYMAQKYPSWPRRILGYLPFVSLQRETPDWTLQDEFAAAYETRHLIVITAHQELAGLYDWLVEWYEAARAGSLHAADVGFDDERLALLSIRARGLRYWKRGSSTAYNDVRDRRDDAPVEDLIPYCYVSALYWSFYQLYRSAYEEVVKPARCKGTLSDGRPCPYAVPVVDGRGPKPTYCRLCRETTKRAKTAARQRRFRKKPSTETEGVTPNNA